MPVSCGEVYAFYREGQDAKDERNIDYYKIFNRISEKEK